MADGVSLPPSGVSAATEEFAGATRLAGFHRQEVVPAIAGAAGSPLTVNATTSSSTLIAANGLRTALILYNNSDTTVWLGFGAAAVVSQGMPLLSGDRIVFDSFWQGDVRGIHGGTGNKAIAYQEFSA